MSEQPGVIHPQCWSAALNQHRDPLVGALQEAGVVTGGLDNCWCRCSYHDGYPAADPPVPAEYWWLTPTSWWLGLCAACCADWRERGVAEPDLMAQRITTTRPA